MKRILLVVAIVATILGASVAGLGAATVTTDETSFTAAGSDELHNATIGVDNDTQSLYVTLDNDEYNATEPANVTVYEVDNGTETQVDKVQISAASGSVETYEFSSLDVSNVTEYRITVIGNTSNIESSALDVGTIEKVSGGGGFLSGSGSIGGVGIVAIVVVGYFVLKD